MMQHDIPLTIAELNRLTADLDAGDVTLAHVEAMADAYPEGSAESCLLALVADEHRNRQRLIALEAQIAVLV